MKQIRSKTKIKRFFESQEVERSGIQLAIMLQDWDDAYNVGGIFRVADAAGVRELILTGKTPLPGDAGQVAVTSMGAHRKVPWRQIPKYLEACDKLISEGYTLVAVEVTDGAVPYSGYEYPEKCCLVLGNEGAGMYGSVLKKCSASVYIPMAGKGRSINVHVAGAIVAFEASFARPQFEATETGEASELGD